MTLRGIDAAVAQLRGIAAHREAYPHCACQAGTQYPVAPPVHAAACDEPMAVATLRRVADEAHAEHEALRRLAYPGARP